jgi:hypothetical protein
MRIPVLKSNCSALLYVPQIGGKVNGPYNENAYMLTIYAQMNEPSSHLDPLVHFPYFPFPTGKNAKVSDTWRKIGVEKYQIVASQPPSDGEATEASPKRKSTRMRENALSQSPGTNMPP